MYLVFEGALRKVLVVKNSVLDEPDTVVANHEIEQNLIGEKGGRGVRCCVKTKETKPKRDT